MFDSDLIKAGIVAILFVSGMIATWLKTGASVREKITRKRSEQNAKSSVQAKERLIDITSADDDEFLDRVRDSERG